VEEHCCKLARKGLTPSQIGVILRDSHGIAQVGSVTGSKVLRILKGKGALPAVARPCPRRPAIPMSPLPSCIHTHCCVLPSHRPHCADARRAKALSAPFPSLHRASGTDGVRCSCATMPRRA
jgi:hypothetical protein